MLRHMYMYGKTVLSLQCLDYSSKMRQPLSSYPSSYPCKNYLKTIKAGSNMAILYQHMRRRVGVSTLVSFPATLPSLELPAHLEINQIWLCLFVQRWSYWIGLLHSSEPKTLLKSRRSIKVLYLCYRGSSKLGKEYNTSIMSHLLSLATFNIAAIAEHK